ncbi:hypothetical protein BC937DRAFT_94809, partial [Endogone sp. FLAS-F59071]
TLLPVNFDIIVDPAALLKPCYGILTAESKDKFPNPAQLGPQIRHSDVIRLGNSYYIADIPVSFSSDPSIDVTAVVFPHMRSAADGDTYVLLNQLRNEIGRAAKTENRYTDSPQRGCY